MRPDGDTAFDDCDWLLGNHSDELTPWLAVMALNSGRRRAEAGHPRPATSFWVLPCCPFGFFAKFQHRKTTATTDR